MTTKAERLTEQIRALNEELYNHQLKCKHKKAIFVNGGNTGNWCRQDDTYWKDWSCPTCLHKWREYLE